jgi:hypothetical protein
MFVYFLVFYYSLLTLLDLNYAFFNTIPMLYHISTEGGIQIKDDYHSLRASVAQTPQWG